MIVFHGEQQNISNNKRGLSSIQRPFHAKTRRNLMGIEQDPSNNMSVWSGSKWGVDQSCDLLWWWKLWSPAWNFQIWRLASIVETFGIQLNVGTTDLQPQTRCGCYSSNTIVNRYEASKGLQEHGVEMENWTTKMWVGESMRNRENCR